MNNENPLVPQGSLLEQKNKSRSRVKTAFFCVLAVHVLAILTALIAQGCNRRQEPVPEQEPQPPATSAPPAFDTNLPPVLDTNLPPAPPPTNAAPVATETAPPPPPPQAPTEYTVAAGDSFYSIGKRFGIPMKAIAEANPGVDPTRLKVGQKLNLPPPKAAAPAAIPGAPAAETVGGEIYVVKSGDTLTRIAAKFGTTVKALRAANNLRTDRIKVGDKLRIPAKAAPPAPAAPPAGGAQAMPEPAPAPAPVNPAPGQ